MDVNKAIFVTLYYENTNTSYVRFAIAYDMKWSNVKITCRYYV